MELKSYWPRYLQGLTEFDQIANAEQPEFTMALQAVRAAPDEFFFLTMSEYGCKRWEAILGLPAAESSTLGERRSRIKAAWNTELPYTYRWLVSWLQSLCGPDNPAPAVDGYTLHVSLPSRVDYAGILDELRRRIPANLVIAPKIRLARAEAGLYVGSAVRLSIKQALTVAAAGDDDGMTAFTDDGGAVITDENGKILYVEDTL